MIFVFLSPTIDLKNLGFTIPENIDKFYGMIVGFLIGVGLLFFVLMKLPFYKKRSEKQVESIDYLLPTNKEKEHGPFLLPLQLGFARN